MKGSGRISKTNWSQYFRLNRTTGRCSKITATCRYPVTWNQELPLSYHYVIPLSTPSVQYQLHRQFKILMGHFACVYAVVYTATSTYFYSPGKRCYQSWYQGGTLVPGSRYQVQDDDICGPAFLVFFAEHTHDTRTHVFLFLHHPPAHCITTVMTNTVCTSLFLFSLTSCYLLLLEPTLFARLPLDSHSLVLWDGR